MAILGVQNNGAGFSRDLLSTVEQRLVYDTGFTLSYTAGHVVTEVGMWLRAAPASSSTVQVGVYDISGGRVGAPLVYSKNITADSNDTAESYITITGLSESLTGLSGGETLAFAVTYNSGDAWPGRRAPEDTSLGPAANMLNDPWSENSTSSTEAPDGYIVIEDGGSVTGDGSHQAAVATQAASGDVGTLRVSLDLVDVSNTAAPNNTGITAVVYDAAGGTEIHETATASITSGTMVISLPSGTTANNGDEVFVTLHKAGATFDDDLNGAGRATVTIA